MFLGIIVLSLEYLVFVANYNGYYFAIFFGEFIKPASKYNFAETQITYLKLQALSRIHVLHKRHFDKLIPLVQSRTFLFRLWIYVPIIKTSDYLATISTFNLRRYSTYLLSASSIVSFKTFNYAAEDNRNADLKFEWTLNILS